MRKRYSAKAVGLRIIYPTDDPDICNELGKLRRGLEEDVAVFIDGSGAVAYASVIDSMGAVRVDDMPTFRRELEALREGLKVSA